MRDSALEPRVRKARRLVAGRPDATEPAGPPAEGTTEELMTIVDSVARYPVILCHQAEPLHDDDSNARLCPPSL